MFTSPFARRRRQLGAIVTGLCLAAGSLGTAALADSGSTTSVSVDASVMVQAGMSPLNARQAAANLNSAIDSAVQAVVRSAATALSSVRPVRSTAAATQTFATEVDAALTGFAVQTVAGLRGAGTSTNNVVQGTLVALAQVVRTAPGIVSVSTGAELAVAGGNDGAAVSATLDPTVDAAIRQTIGDSVRALRPILPLTRSTVRAVAAGVRQIEDASVVALTRTLRATVALAASAVNVSSATLEAMRTVAESAVTAANRVVVAVDAALDNLSDVNLTSAVDASLQVSASSSSS
jgi:hypothetical protein